MGGSCCDPVRCIGGHIAVRTRSIGHWLITASTKRHPKRHPFTATKAGQRHASQRVRDRADTGTTTPYLVRIGDDVGFAGDHNITANPNTTATNSNPTGSAKAEARGGMSASLDQRGFEAISEGGKCYRPSDPVGLVASP